MPLKAAEELVERRFNIGSLFLRQLFEICFDLSDFILQDGFNQRGLAWKAGIQGFLAHPQLSSKIIHAHRAKTVGKELVAGCADDSSSGGTTY